MRGLSGVVRREPLLNVRAKTGIELVGVRQALKDVDVIQPALLRAMRFGGQPSPQYVAGVYQPKPL